MIKKAIHDLRKKLRESNFLVPLDDEFLIKFLWARKFDIEKSMDLIETYVSLHRMYASSYEKFDVNNPRLMELFKSNWGAVLENRNKQGSRIASFIIRKWNPEINDLDDIFIACQLYLELIISEPETQKDGVVAVVDAKDISYSHCVHFTPFAAKKYVSLYNSFPVKVKGVHIINESPLINFLFKILVKPLLKKKQRERIFFYGNDLRLLHNHIDPNILPEEFGGNQPATNSTYIVQRVREQNDKLKILKNQILSFCVTKQIHN